MTGLGQNGDAVKTEAEICHGQCTPLEDSWKHAYQQGEYGAHQRDPAAGPAHGTDERDAVRAQKVGCGLQAFCLINGVDHPLDLIQSSGKSCGQMIGQKTEGAMPLGAVPARNQGSRRRDPPVGTMACETTAPLGVKRATQQTCRKPCLSCNVVFAGVTRRESKLHRQ